MNGTTSPDRTNYFEELPPSELRLALWLEADRMKWLDVTAENFENQRVVVQEEYRMRVANRAYGPAFIELNRLVYENYFAYSHDTLGSLESLAAAQFAWVEGFHRRHYAPDNAVLSVAGDFDTDQAAAWVRQYFGSAKRASVAPAAKRASGTPRQNEGASDGAARPSLPEQATARQATVSDPHAKTPGVLLGFAIPSAKAADHPALELLALILAEGDSSVLHQKLVLQRALAQSVSAWTNGHVGPDLFGIFVRLAEGATPDAVETVIWAEIERLARRGPSADELGRARSRTRTDYLLGLESNMTRAIRLGEYELLWDDARFLAKELSRSDQVEANDIQAAAKKYLTRNRSSRVRVTPTVEEQP
jgi:zinc protease